MVKASNKTIGLLGGTFDPAHKGHLAITKIAIKKLKLSRVLWVITKKNPFKDNPYYCLLYTSDAADDTPCVDLGGRRIIKKK